jgi:hypothetical protein
MADLPKPSAGDPNQPQKLESPYGPLLLFLVPLVALILYGLLTN